MSTNKKSGIKSPSIFPNIIEDSDRFSLVVVEDLLSVKIKKKLLLFFFF
jgi:hypothetical protein